MAGLSGAAFSGVACGLLNSDQNPFAGLIDRIVQAVILGSFFGLPTVLFSGAIDQSPNREAASRNSMYMAAVMAMRIAWVFVSIVD